MGLRRAPLALSALLAVALAACGAPSASPPVTSPASVPARSDHAAAPTGSGSSTTTSSTLPPNELVLEKGGTVTVAVPRIPNQLNPWTPDGSNAVTAEIMEQVLPQAWVSGRTGPPELGPGLLVTAEDTSVSPQVVVYTINPKATWSDGVPITAADFIYDWHEQLAVGPSLPATDPLVGYERIRSITGSSGGKTVTVVFSKPYSDWNALFSDLVPAHTAEAYGFEGALAGAAPPGLVSGGPFAITKIVPGSEVVLTRNPSYWGKPAILDHIVFKVVRGQAALLAGLENRSIDVAQLSPDHAVSAAIETTPTIGAQSVDSPVLWQLCFNLADPTVGSLTVRRAIAKAIDRHQLIADTIGLQTAFSQVASNRLFISGAPGSVGDGSGYSGPGIALADTELESVGYTMNRDGLLESSTGIPLSLDLVGPSHNATVAAMEAELQAELLQAGITLVVHNVSQSSLLDTLLPSGTYQLAIAPFLQTPFPSASLPVYTAPVGPTPVAPTSSTPTTVPGAPGPQPVYVAGTETDPSASVIGAVTRDVLGYEDPQVVALYDEASQQLSTPDADNLYNQIDQLIWSDVPTLPLFEAPLELINALDVVNISETSTLSGPMWDAEDWAIQLNPPTGTTTTTTTPS